MTGGKQIHLEDVGVKRKAVGHDKSEAENQANASNQADRPAESTTNSVGSTEKQKASEQLSPPKQAGPEAKRQKAEDTPDVAKGFHHETEADDSKGSQLEQPPKGKAACTFPGRTLFMPIHLSIWKCKRQPHKLVSPCRSHRAGEDCVHVPPPVSADPSAESPGFPSKRSHLVPTMVLHSLYL